LLAWRENAVQESLAMFLHRVPNARCLDDIDPVAEDGHETESKTERSGGKGADARLDSPDNGSDTAATSKTGAVH
jgi:hypothetical protein